MFVDNTWEDSEVQGFQFDWDATEQTPSESALTTAWVNEFCDLSLEPERIRSETEGAVCVVCSKPVGQEIYYEDTSVFCSEICWQSVLSIAIDDYVTGGVSAWPLNTFTSFAAKSHIMNLAVKSFDGDLIIRVVRQLQNSLSKDTFKQLLMQNPTALKHFMNFLRKTEQYDTLADYQLSIGSVEQARIRMYIKHLQRLASVDSSNAEEISHRLRIFALTELSNDAQLSLLQETTSQLADLLQFQSQHQPEWNALCRSTLNSDDSKSNSEASLLALPLGDTARACVWMDKGSTSGTRTQQLRSNYKIPDDQFRWLMIEPLVLSSNWNELDSVLLEKKWIKRRASTLLPSDRIVFHLASLSAPSQILAKYLGHCEDRGEMVSVAVNLQLFKEAMNICLKARDQVFMKELLDRTPKAAPEHARMLHYLSIPTNKWKEETET